MRSNLKKFRIQRSSENQAAPKSQVDQNTPPPLETEAEPPEQHSRLETAVRNRVAQSLDKDREEQEESGLASPDDTPAHTPTLSPREEIAKIKQENLTGRQLRIARRLAQKNGLQATSDLDAVRLLRNRGIDPFNRGELMDVGGVPDNQPVALPATVRQNKGSVGKPIKQPQIIDDDTREREVRKIQRGLVQRRRKRLAVLMVKLACYVMLPSLIAGYYFYRVATPMYATYTEFVIQQAEAPGATGGFFSGSPFATATDSITVQGYLTSRDAMLRLDEDPGFRSMFQNEEVDVLQRLAKDASNEDAYALYKKKVVIGFDPTEGVVKMEVITPSPASSLELSRTLIAYAEERVDQQTKRLREDTMKGAQVGYDDSEAKLTIAQDNVANLQRKLNTFDPTATFSLLQSQIGELETLILEKELERAELTANTSPNPTKLRILDQKLAVLNRKLTEKQSRVIEGADGQTSIVEVNASLTHAQTNLALRQELLAQSLLSLEAARVEAGRQTRYLSMGVEPVQTDQAAYPRAFENTLLSIIVFAGLYLIMSLTISILREQVTT